MQDKIPQEEKEYEDFSDIQEERSSLFEDRLDVAADLKEKGNKFFREGDLINAEECYHRALYHIHFDFAQWNFELLDEHRDQVLVIKNPLCLNLAAVRLKYGNYDSVLMLADEVLKEEENNVKALFRKAQALKETKDYETAYKTISSALKLSPKDNSIRELLQTIKELYKKEKERSDAIWKGRFKKVIQYFNPMRIVGIKNPINIQYSFFPILI
jgi:FK506-binding protein 4/5